MWVLLMFSQINVIFKITIESKFNNNFKSYIDLEIDTKEAWVPFSITPPQNIKQYPNLRQKSTKKKKKCQISLT